MLKSVYLSLRKVKAQRVTVEFAMYDRSDDGVGCFEIKGDECSAVDECDSSRTYIESDDI